MEQDYDCVGQFEHDQQSVALFRGQGCEKIGSQHLDSTEDLQIVLMDEAEVKDLMVNDQIRQSLMAAPLWKFFAENKMI